MRMAAGAFAIAAVLRLPLAQPSALVTVAQRDEWRSNADRTSVAISADGRYIAFESYARLAPADTNGARDVYVFDRLAGHVTLESVAPDGSASRVDSAHPHISGDGRLLVYESLRNASGRVEAVLRDRQRDTLTFIGRKAEDEAAGGSIGAPAISADGRVVAFVSTANLLGGRDANGQGTDVYLYDVGRGTIRLVSVDAAGRQPSSGSSLSPTLSDDGRYVAFTSTAPIDAAVVTLQRSVRARRPPLHIYVRDTPVGQTRLVSVGRDGRLADGDSWEPAIAGGGRHLAFVSSASNLVADDRNRVADVFVADLQTGATELVSRSATRGPANGRSGLPSLSADGRFVVFQSEASNLACARDCGAELEDINLLPDVFLFDRRTGAMTRVSADAAGGWLEASAGPAIDAAGEVVAFSSRHPIDAADTRHDFDLFVRAAPLQRRAYR